MRRRDGVFECYATTTCVTRRVTRGTWPRHGATRAIALRMPHTVHLLCLCVRKPVTAARSHRIAARLDVPRRAWKDLSRDASPHARHGPLPHPVPPRRRSACHARPWRPASCGEASRDPKTCRPSSPAPLPRAPPHVPRQGPHGNAHKSRAIGVVCREAPVSVPYHGGGNPWPPRIDERARTCVPPTRRDTP